MGHYADKAFDVGSHGGADPQPQNDDLGVALELYGVFMLSYGAVDCLEGR